MQTQLRLDLTDLGYQAKVAGSGEEAQQLLSRERVEEVLAELLATAARGRRGRGQEEAAMHWSRVGQARARGGKGFFRDLHFRDAWV